MPPSSFASVRDIETRVSDSAIPGVPFDTIGTVSAPQFTDANSVNNGVTITTVVDDTLFADGFD